MSRTEKYFIGPQLLGDIRRVVGRVDADPIGSEVTRIPTRLQDMSRPPGSGAFRLATFTGTWSIDTTHVVTFLNGATATATAVNHYFGVKASVGTACKVGLASEGNTWHLVFVDLTKQQDYSTSTATQEQLLGHVSGALKWYDITSCGTATASP